MTTLYNNLIERAASTHLDGGLNFYGNGFFANPLQWRIDMTAERAIQAYKSKPVDENELIKRTAFLLTAARTASPCEPVCTAYSTTFGSRVRWHFSKHIDASMRAEVLTETFAEHRVRGAMLDEMRKQDHLPRRLRAQTESVKNAKKRIANDKGREATSEEVCAELDIDISQLANLENLTQPLVSIENVDPYDEDKEDSPYSILENKELKAMVTESIGTLPENGLQLSCRFTTLKRSLTERLPVFWVSLNSRLPTS